MTTSCVRSCLMYSANETGDELAVIKKETEELHRKYVVMH